MFVVSNSSPSRVFSYSARLLLVCAVLSGCDSNSAKLSTPSNSEISRSDRILQSPVDVMSEFVLKTARAVDSPTESDNLLANAGFEEGTGNWSVCAGDGLVAKSTDDVYDGTTALTVNSGNCIYQSVEITAGMDLLLSCFAKTLDKHPEWTGMGLGFSDENWKALTKSAPSVISAPDWARYDVRATAPENARYVSMWFFSETPAAIDACSLVRAEGAPPPENFNGTNLLSNADFTVVNKDMPDSWVDYCKGVSYASTDSVEAELLLGDGACVAQGLTANALTAIEQELIEFSCDIEYTGSEYAEIILNLDGKDYVTVVPPGSDGLVQTSFATPAKVESGFVSLYSESAPENMRVRSCELSVHETPGISGEVELIVNGSFNKLNSLGKPAGWRKGCDGGWESVNGDQLELTGTAPACVRQTLSEEAIAALTESTIEMSCDVKNSDIGALSSMELRFNNGASTVRSNYVRDSVEWESLVISGELTRITDAEIVLSARGGAIFDNCTIDIVDPSGDSFPVIDLRLNVEGRDIYEVEAPFSFDVVVTNEGEQFLSDVQFEADSIECSGYVASLEPGETYTNQCVSNKVQEGSDPVEISITAEAMTEKGSIVTDTDAVGYVRGVRSNPNFLLSIVAKDRQLKAGDDAEFTVSVAAVGVVVRGIAAIESNIPQCSRALEPPLANGDHLVYECSVPNVTSDFVASVEAQSCQPPCVYLVDRSDSTSIEVSGSVEPTVPDNLLANSEFTEGEETATGWTDPCGGGYQRTNGFNGALVVNSGACVQHLLSDEAVNALAGNYYSLSCEYTKSSDGNFAELSTNLTVLSSTQGESSIRKILPRTYFGGVPQWQFETVTIVGKAEDSLEFGNTYVSLRETAESGLLVLGCKLELASGRVYKIGDIGPAGGTVFSVSADGLQGLEAAPTDVNADGGTWCSATVLDTDPPGVDIEGMDNIADVTTPDRRSGAYNSDRINNKCAAGSDGTAASMARSYIWPEGQTEGYLPNKEELLELYQQKNVVGGFSSTGVYASSTESDAVLHWGLSTETGDLTTQPKASLSRARSIREF